MVVNEEGVAVQVRRPAASAGPQVSGAPPIPGAAGDAGTVGGVGVPGVAGAGPGGRKLQLSSRHELTRWAADRKLL